MPRPRETHDQHCQPPVSARWRVRAVLAGNLAPNGDISVTRRGNLSGPRWTPLVALRAFASARGWAATEFVDHGVSGAKERRPQLDAMLVDVRRRKFDLVLVTKLDRLARRTLHLVTLAGELEAIGVDLVVLDQAIDTTTPSGRLLFDMLAAIAEFERDLIRDRVIAGLRRARAQGRRLGRPRRRMMHDAHKMLQPAKDEAGEVSGPRWTPPFEPGCPISRPSGSRTGWMISGGSAANSPPVSVGTGSAAG